MIINYRGAAGVIRRPGIPTSDIVAWIYRATAAAPSGSFAGITSFRTTAVRTPVDPRKTTAVGR